MYVCVLDLEFLDLGQFAEVPRIGGKLLGNFGQRFEPPDVLYKSLDAVINSLPA